VKLGFHFGTPRDNGVQRQLGELLARRLASADMLGRMQILRHAQNKTGKALPLATGARSLRFAEDDDQSITTGFSFDMPNVAAEKYLSNLTPITRELFDGLTSQYRKDAFTLAGTSDVRLIAKIRDRMAEIAKNGETPADFHAAVQKLTSDAGVEDLNAFTLDTAFQTGMQKAYSAGRLEQMQEPHMLDALPFWQYWTVGDTRVRPGHAELDGFIARAIDPVWRKIYPPWDFNCRCSVVPIPEDEALDIDPDASEGGLERIALKPLTILELESNEFRSLMAA
jgi:SPP1 gp7 family putative phage head morphogenesis protein